MSEGEGGGVAGGGCAVPRRREGGERRARFAFSLEVYSKKSFNEKRESRGDRGITRVPLVVTHLQCVPSSWPSSHIGGR